jgi:thiamine-phosphate pyrophosphorylase
LISLAQSKGVAALLLSDAAQASKLGADGIHISWTADVVERFKAIRRDTGTGMIVGADAGRTRHDAMELGEAGADYVAFGIPSNVEDPERAAGRQLDLVSWWSEVFEVPCVAFDIANVDDARRLAVAGADFVGIAIKAGDGAPEAAARIRAYSQAVSAHEDVK